MAQQLIDIGVQGNDGTGDSIRDSFRKVNENFQEIYAVFGAGGTIPFTALSDAPSSYVAGQIFYTQNVNGTPRITAKTLEATTGITLDTTSDPTKIRLVGQLSNLSNDTSPRLTHAMDANYLAIGNIPDPSQTLVNNFNAAFAGVATTTIDRLPISKGYADTHYLQATAGTNVIGAVRVRDEPSTPQITDIDYDPTLTGNYVKTEAIQRQHVVYRGGDTMTGKLTLSDHPGAISGAGTPKGADDLQAASKYYVDNKTFASGINLFVSTTTGDDTQLYTPPGLEGRFWNYAYKTIGAAALKAQTLQSLASQEPGPYRQKIAFTISPNQYYSTLTNVSLTGGNSSTQGFLDAAYLLESNRTFIQTETIAYINNKYVNSFTYDQTKCQRDVGLILNAVGTDLVLNTNFNSLLAGLSYFDYQASNVVNNQLVQTVDAINYAYQQVASYAYNNTNLTAYLNRVITAINYDQLFGSNYQSISVARYFQYANTGVTVTEMLAALDNLYNSINSLALINQNNAVQTNIINNFTTIKSILQGGTVPVASIPAVPGSSAAANAAAILLLNNISFFEAEIIAYLGASFPGLSFSTSMCKRDVGLITQAVAYDQLYGGNAQTIYAGQQYWINNTRQIATTEVNATASAMAYLGTLMKAAIQNQSPSTVYQTAVIQYQNQSYASAASQLNTINGLISIVSGTTVTVTATSSNLALITTSDTSGLNTGSPIVFASPTSITITGFQSTAGSGPYSVTFVIPTQSTAPRTNISYTIAGNSNSNFNGTYVATSSTKTSITFSYASNPGSYGSGTTTFQPFYGNIVGGQTYYITSIYSSTKFTVSANPNGSNLALVDSAVYTTATVPSIVNANTPPTGTYPDTTKATSARQNVFGSNGLGNTTQQTTFVNTTITFLQSSYPYISNVGSLPGLKTNFGVVTSVLAGGLGNRPAFYFNAPSSLNTAIKNAATLLTKNIAFVQAEVLGYVLNLQPTFTYVSATGAQQFAKDIQILIEATAYDMVYGGNSGAYTASSQFWYTNAAGVLTSTIDPTEQSVKFQALNYCQTLLGNIVTNQAPGASLQSYNVNYCTYSTKSGTGPYLVTLNLTTPRVVPMPVGTKVTLAGQSNTSYNVTSTVVASTTTSMTLSYASDPGVWSNATSTYFVITQFIDSINYNTVDGGSNSLVTALINSEWTLINAVISADTAQTVTTPDLTNSVYASTGYVDVRNTINNNSTAIAQAVTNYLNQTYKGGFSYNQSTCYRDVGLIADAMVVDLLTGGTYQSINAGKSYYKNSSAKNIAIGTQNKETIDGLVFAEQLMLQVLSQTTANRYQTLVSQTTYDATKNANSGYVATASYTSIVGTTLTVSSVSGTIQVGMVVSGPGFISGQVVTAVNGTTITLNATSDSTPNGTLSFTLTAVKVFTNNYTTMLNIINNGVSVAPTPSFGSGIYSVSFTNGGNGNVDQGVTGDIKILAGKVLRGVTSGITGNIISYTQGGTAQSDTVTFYQTQPGFFQYLSTTASGTLGNNTITVASTTGSVIGYGLTQAQVGMGVNGSGIPLGVTITAVNGNVITLSANLTATITNSAVVIAEQLEYAESVSAQQIVIQVEAGVYYEDYPIKVPANVSVRGDEFRRTIVRPLDRVSQSPWRGIFFYRDSIIDGMAIGPINNGVGSTDYVPNTAILGFSSKTAVGDGTYRVTFTLPTQPLAPNTSLTYTITGNTNLSYNGSYQCYASTTTSITLIYPSDPGVYGTLTTTYINPLVNASLSGSSGSITITLSNNTQASVSWLGYVFQVDSVDAYGKPGQAVVNSVSGNFMNCTVVYPFSIPGSINISNLVGSFQLGETITQASTGAVGTITGITSGQLSYTPVTGTFVISSAITGVTSGATATVTSVTLSSVSAGSWHLYTTNNYGRHYLTDPTQQESATNPPKNNKEIDMFLCNDATRISNISGQGHGGFMMVLDPEGQIKSKSPYGQVCTSFSRSINKQTFAGGQFIDGFTGRLFGTITYASTDGFTVTATGGINSGLDVRAPQAPCAFYVNGNRYQINAITSYVQIYDSNNNVIGGSATFSMSAATPWTAGTGQAINIEMGGNKSMLANDYAQINDLGYAILATNGGITEQVSTFTYYCYTHFWALNGGQIRSVGSSSAHGVYGLRATGYDVTELPDSVNLANNLAQTARIYNPPTLPSSSSNNQFYNSMSANATTVYIIGYDYYPTNISELEIDHTLAGKGVVRYQVNSVSHTTIYVPTGSVGTGYSVNAVTFTSTTGTTLVVSSTSGVVVGQSVTGTGFVTGQFVTAIAADGITLTISAPADYTPSGTLYIGDSITISGSVVGGKDSTLSANAINGSNVLTSVSTLNAVTPSAAIILLPYGTTGYVTKTGTGPYLVTFNMVTQAASLALTSGYTIYGSTNTNYNGAVTVTASSLNTVTLSYASDPGTFDFTTTLVLMPPGTTVTSVSKTGTGPYFVQYNWTTPLASAPLVGGRFRISGNGNSNFNGIFTSTASSTTSVTLRYGTDPGASTLASTTVTFMGSTITVDPNNVTIPANATALAVYQGNQIILSTPAIATNSGIVYSSNSGNDITIYPQTLTNTAVATFSYVGNALSNLTNTYSNIPASSSSGVGQYAYFNISVNAGSYYAAGGGSVLLGGQNVLALNLSTSSGSSGYSSTGLAASLYDGQMIQIRVLQNFKFYNVNNVNPTRPSTAVQFNDNLASIYRVLSYNLTEATNEILPNHISILSADQSFAYYIFQADPASISKVDPVDGGSKTMGATPGDTRIAVTVFGPQSYIDQINKGTYAFAWGGRVHTISSYTPPVTTAFYTGYNPTGSSGTNLVVSGTFTGNTTVNSTNISNVSSFTGLVIGEVITGSGIPTGTTIVSVNVSAGTVTLSSNASATATGVTLTWGGTTGMFAGMTVTGTGFLSGQTIVSITNSTTLVLSKAPDATPSGTLLFSYSTTPYITLGATKYTIANSGNATTTTVLNQQSRGQIVATYSPSGTLTANTTSGSTNVLNASSLVGIGAGSSLGGNNIYGQQVVNATATTLSTAVMATSTINSSGVLTVGTVSSGTVAVGMQLSGPGVVIAQNNGVSGTSGNGTTATLTLVTPTPTLTGTAQTGSLLTVSSTSGLAVNQQIIFTTVQQSTTASATTNATFGITGSTITGYTLTVGTVSSGTVAVGYQLTGTGVLAGTYIVANITGSGAGSTWQVSQNHTVSTGAISITGTLNSITVGSTAGFVVGEPVTFGTALGNLATSTTYYISEVISGTTFSVVSTYGSTTNFTLATASGSSAVTAGATLGGVTSGTTYYITSVNTSTNQITVSTSYGGSNLALTNANGTWTSIAGTPYVTGSTIVVTGLTNSGYNTTGSTVTASSLTSTALTVSYSNSTTGAIPVVTATYVSGGQTSTTMILSGISGGSIVVGMTVTGTGFVSNQTVLSVSGTTIILSALADSTPSGTLSFRQYGSVNSSGPTYITANISGTGTGSTWQTSTALAVSSTTITGNNYLVTLSSTTNIVAGNSITFDPTSGASFGGLSNSGKYFIKQVLAGNQVILSSYGVGSQYLNNGYASAATPVTTATGSITGRTDTIVVSTSSSGSFTGTLTSTSNVITGVPSSVFQYLTVGISVGAGSGGPITGSTTITSFNAGANTITMSNAASNSGSYTITYTTNNLVISAAAKTTGTSANLFYNTLSTVIQIYTNDKTGSITAGMTLFGNGFTSGQTVISATASSSGAPTTTVVLSAAPNSVPFGVLGFTLLSNTLGPWYTTYTFATQATAPIIDCYYYISGNSNTKYNGWVQAVASTTSSITFAYITDPESTITATYVSNTGTTLVVSSTSGLSVGSVVRGGGTGGYFGQKIVSISTDGLTLTLDGTPSGTPTGLLTFTVPYGSGSTTFQSNTTGISRPMSSLVSNALQAGYQAGSLAQITTRISTTRCSAHDMLDIGTGGYNTTNYPYQIYGNPFIKAAQTQEVKEETVGRVFYVTTDQNGIFRVGRFFTVDQGTGTVTFAASIALSNLNGLGFKRGVVVAEFSTDSTMTNDASDTVPTQSAVRGYIDNRLGVQQSGSTTPATSLIGNGYMELSGKLPMKGNMSMGGYTIGSMGNPLLSTDAATKGYVDLTVSGVNAISKLGDVSITNPANNWVLVYNSSTSKWTGAGFAQGVGTTTYSDVLVNFDGTTLTSTVQGAVVTATYTNVASTTLTVSSTTGIIPGMTITGTGFTSGQKVVSVTNTIVLQISAPADTTPSGTLTFTRAGVITNNKVNQYAAIAQSKLAMQIAATNGTTAPVYSTIAAGLITAGKRYQINTANDTDFRLIGSANNISGTVFQATGPGTGTGTVFELDAIQSVNGLSSYNANVFTVNNGWVDLKSATSSATDGISPTKLQFIAANSVLANITSGTAGVTAVSTQTMVANGDGIRNQDIPTTTSATGAVIRTSVSPYQYDVTPISTTGGNNSLVKTDGSGNINVQGIKIASYPVSGNMIDVGGGLLNFYTPNSASSVKFMTATYSNSANAPVVTHYGNQDFSSSGVTVIAPNVTTSLANNTTAGTLSGAWKLSANSSLDLNTNSNTLKLYNITTNGSDSGAGSIQGTWTLTGSSKLQATYADLAEWYSADAEYEPGTVLVFGGEAEVTTTKLFEDRRVAGVVTTDPAYTMNQGLEGTKACLALVGRTPVKVLGTVKKGDMLTTASVPGYACKAMDPKFGTIIGKALEDKTDPGMGVIEVAVGRM